MTHKIILLILLLSMQAFSAGELRIAIPTQPESLYYPVSVDNVSDLVTQLVVESLVTVDQKTNDVIPLLAKKWQIQKDSIRFELDEKARFSDGTPVTPNEVVSTFEAFKNKNIPSPDFTANFSDLNELKVVSPNQVQFRFKNLTPDTLRKFAGFTVLPANAVKQFEDSKQFSKNLMGSGPYKVERVEAGKQITLVKNANYWRRENPSQKNLYRFEKILLKVISDPNAQIEMLKNGMVDYLYILSSKTWNTELNDKAFTSGRIVKTETKSKLPYQTVGIVWNTRLPLFKSAKTRHALSHLFPVSKFIKNFFYNSYIPATGIFHSQSECHSSQNTAKEFAPDKAEKLLLEDGWVKNPEGLWQKDNLTLKFTLTVRQPQSLKYLTLYQAELKKAGILMELKVLDWVEALNKVRKGEFEAAEYSMDRPELISDLETLWSSKGDLNYAGLSDSETDRLLTKLKNEWDPKQRTILCQQLDKRVADLQPLSFGWDQIYLRLAYSSTLDTSNEPVYPYATWRNAFYHWDKKNNVP